MPMNIQAWVEQSAMLGAFTVQALAIAILVFGSLQAFISSARDVIRGAGIERPMVWLRFTQWLGAGLTFQMAADMIETSVSPSWDHLGKLAVVAAIRGALSLSLEHDTEAVRKRMLRDRAAQRQHHEGSPPATTPEV
jgi:uncharacterized membrane protein